jgi:hypothetical protein
MLEDTYEFEECIEAWHDLTRLNVRDLDLRQTDAASKFGLAPAKRVPHRDEIVPN